MQIGIKMTNQAFAVRTKSAATHEKKGSFFCSYDDVIPHPRDKTELYRLGEDSSPVSSALQLVLNGALASKVELRNPNSKIKKLLKNFDLDQIFRDCLRDILLTGDAFVYFTRPGSEITMMYHKPSDDMFIDKNEKYFFQKRTSGNETKLINYAKYPGTGKYRAGGESIWESIHYKENKSGTNEYYGLPCLTRDGETCARLFSISLDTNLIIFEHGTGFQTLFFFQGPFGIPEEVRKKYQELNKEPPTFAEHIQDVLTANKGYKSEADLFVIFNQAIQGKLHIERLKKFDSTDFLKIRVEANGIVYRDFGIQMFSGDLRSRSLGSGKEEEEKFKFAEKTVFSVHRSRILKMFTRFFIKEFGHDPGLSISPRSWQTRKELREEVEFLLQFQLIDVAKAKEMLGV